MYEAGKMAGLLLAGALIGGGENAEEMLNSGLTGGLAKPDYDSHRRAGLFCAMEAVSSFSARKTDGSERNIAVFYHGGGAGAGVEYPYGISAAGSVFRKRSGRCPGLRPMPLWLGIVLYGLAAPFPRSWFSGASFMEKQEISSGLRRPWFFRPDIWNLSRESGAGYLCSISGNRACMDDGTYGNLLAPMIFHGIGNITVFLLIDAAGLGGGAGKAVDLCGASFLSARYASGGC